MRNSGEGRESAAAGLLAGAASAGLVALATPPYGWAGLALLAPLPLFWAGLQSAPWRGVVASLTFGLLLLLFVAPWFRFFTMLGYIVAALFWSMLALLTFGTAFWIRRRCPAVWAPPLLAASWVVLEWLRAQGTLAFPWGALSATQARVLPLLQIVELTGSYGLSFLLCLPAAAVACRLAAPPRRPAMGWIWASAALLGAAALFGAARLSEPPSGDLVRAALVQGSRSEARPGAAVVCISDPQVYLELTEKALREGAELVVWPESASNWDLVHDHGARIPLVIRLQETGATLLAGGFVRDGVTGRLMNSATLVDTSGRQPDFYSKVLLVPFGEYLPARAILGWTEAKGMPSEDMLPGRSHTPLAWERGSIGVNICFESAFGEPSRQAVAKGASLLAVLTSDGWAGRDIVAHQHSAFAPLRAVENRRSVVRAAATGISELLDPYGRSLTTIPLFRQDVTIAEAPLRRDLTLYNRLGDWPVPLAWLILIGALWSTRRQRAPGTPRENDADQPAVENSSSIAGP